MCQSIRSAEECYKIHKEKKNKEQKCEVIVPMMMGAEGEINKWTKYK